MPRPTSLVYASIACAEIDLVETSGTSLVKRHQLYVFFVNNYALRIEIGECVD